MCLLCTYLLLVFNILRCFLNNHSKSNFFLFWVASSVVSLDLLNLHWRFFCYIIVHVKPHVFLVTDRVALKCLGFFSYWFKWKFAQQRHSHGAVLRRQAARCQPEVLPANITRYSASASPCPDQGRNASLSPWLQGDAAVPRAELSSRSRGAGRCDGMGGSFQYSPISVLSVKSWGRPWTKISLPLPFGGALIQPAFTGYP